MEATVVAVVLSAIAAVLAGFGQLRQRKTEDAALVVSAQRDHMRLLTDENADLRERLRTAESRIGDQQSQIGDMRVAIAHCDADKNALKVQVDELRRRLDADH